MTDVASQFESGHPRYVAGMSGIELTCEVMDEVGDPIGTIEYTPRTERSPEYWCGWALAYYQWYSGKSFKEIIQGIPVDEIVALYLPLHEADIEKFTEVMEQRMQEAEQGSRLQKMRKNTKLSQAELAKRAGVTLRSIQMYEQQNKDVRKAKVERMLRITKVLGCELRDIL